MAVIAILQTVTEMISIPMKAARHQILLKAAKANKQTAMVCIHMKAEMVSLQVVMVRSQVKAEMVIIKAILAIIKAEIAMPKLLFFQQHKDKIMEINQATIILV